MPWKHTFPERALEIRSNLVVKAGESRAGRRNEWRTCVGCGGPRACWGGHSPALSVSWNVGFFFKKYLFIYLALLGLTAACWTFDLCCGMLTLSYSMWDLVPWRGIKPRPLAFGVRSLSHWITSKILKCWFQSATFLHFKSVDGKKCWSHSFASKLNCENIGRVLRTAHSALIINMAIMSYHIFLLSFLVLIIMVRLIVLILSLLESPVITVVRENVVSISTSYEDLNNRPMNETVCSEVTLSWWGIGKVLIKSWRIDAFELWCWRRLLRVHWIVRRSNQSILKEISPEYSLEGLMLKRQYFGHLMQRTDSLEKTLMLGKIESRRRRGWQRMRWMDGIIDLKDMSLSKLGS